jgi:hypothetical protein
MGKIRESRSLVIYWNMKQGGNYIYIYIFNIKEINGIIAFELEICKLSRIRIGVGKRKVPVV